MFFWFIFVFCFFNLISSTIQLLVLVSLLNLILSMFLNSELHEFYKCEFDLDYADFSLALKIK